MSDRRQELLEAVLDDPHRDEPRLAYAAYIEHDQDPQAEFIRLQVAAWHERRVHSRASAEYWRLYKAAQVLREANETTWTAGLAGLATSPGFYRGFVEGVSTDAATFLARGTELFRTAPIRHLTLSHTRGVIDRIAACELLSQLVTLQFYEHRDQRLDDAGLETLLGSPHLGSIRYLDLGGNAIGMPGLEALCMTRNLPNLAYVNFAGNPVDDPNEVCGEDWMNGRMIPESITQPPLGRELEARFGYKAWLHGPTLLVNHPPTEADF